MERQEINARFICALTIYGYKKTFTFFRYSKGIISNKKRKMVLAIQSIPKGSKLTFGQMKPSKKYKIDHRFIAFKKIKKFF